MQRKLVVVVLLVATAGCISAPNRHGYAFVEHVPDSEAEHAVPAESLDAPSELREAFEEATENPETPSYGPPERASAPLTRAEYDRLAGDVSGRNSENGYGYVEYHSETLKVHFEEALVDR